MEQPMAQDPLFEGIKQDILELIPNERMSVEQKAFQPATRERFSGPFLPMYKLRREPRHLNDFPSEDSLRIAIWRDNGTLLTVCNNLYAQYEEKHVCINIYRDGKPPGEFAIYGKTDSAIAETMVFFCSIISGGEGKARLKFFAHEEELRIVAHRKEFCFDFAALQEEQLVYILDTNPGWCFELQTGCWNTNHSLILATRPYPLDLWLTFSQRTSGFIFDDEGTAFVNALVKRKLSFGSLSIAAEMDDHINLLCNTDKMPISRANLHRILNTAEKFDKLAFSPLDSISVLLPFSAHVKALDYQVDVKYMRPEDFESLNIATRDLTLKFFHDENDIWEDVCVASLNRVAELGHFEGFGFSVDEYFIVESGTLYLYEFVQPLAEALIRVINGNPNLTHLDISGSYWFLDWGPHLKEMFKAVEKHEGLRTFTVQCYEWGDCDDDDESKLRHPQYSWLEQLLKSNRNITVFERSGKRCSNKNIENLYLLNHIYIGSARLVTESTSERPSLVATALTESASENFQLTSMLLSDQTDVLCQFINFSFPLEDHDLQH
jgi:hypothetical protein